MGKWKDAFLKSLDSKFETPESFLFGPPATVTELAALSSAISAEIPNDLSDLLREFNGVKKVGEREPYYFDTQTMPIAGEYYRDWDCETEFTLDLFKNVLWVCQDNGYASMWAVVVKPFTTYQFGDVVSFDHDRIMFAKSGTDLFTVNYENLEQLVEAKFKDAG
jgi:hypothetical protein